MHSIGARMAIDARRVHSRVSFAGLVQQGGEHVIGKMQIFRLIGDPYDIRLLAGGYTQISRNSLKRVVAWVRFSGGV